MIEFTGTYLRWIDFHFFKDDEPTYADARYVRSGWVNDDIRLDGRDLPKPFLEDRARHRYLFPVTGANRTVSLELRTLFKEARGKLMVHVRQALAEEVELIVRPEREAARALAAAEAEKARVAAQEAARKRAVEAEEDARRRAVDTRRRRENVASFVQRHEHRAHLQTPDYLERYARLHGPALLERREEILDEHAFFHRKEELVADLRQWHPDIYERCLWEVRALAIAERLSVEPPPPPPAAPAPPPAADPSGSEARRKPTPEEWRARQARRMTMKAEDVLAQIKLRAEMQRKLQELSNTLAMDDDEYQRMATKLDELFEDQQERNDGKDY
ncbi:MAG: hypothetical protein IT294_18250 [Deltaproteobacteria bacterium]|nr:hypothetical protein [Deltaproteobacteria bacterium]